jgi:YD repeat-containing protein
VAEDWGSDGRLLYRSSDNTSLSYLTYRYDGDDNIGAITDQLGPGGTQLYGYDQLDRLNFTLLQPGSTAGTTSYSYTPGTNRLASLSDASGARSITYDARGNTASEVRPGGIAATTAYDGYARLTSYSRSDVGSYERARRPGGDGPARCWHAALRLRCRRPGDGRIRPLRHRREG